MADQKDVAISASMTDKDLLSSIDQTLKKVEKRFTDSTTKLENSLSGIETVAKEIGANIGKGLSKGFDDQIKGMEEKIRKLQSDLVEAGKSASKGTTPTATAASTPGLDVNALNSVYEVIAKIEASFKNISETTQSINRSVNKLSNAKSATYEEKVNKEVAQREKELLQEALHRQKILNISLRQGLEEAKNQKTAERTALIEQQKLQIAQKRIAAESKNRVSEGGKSYESAMAMEANSIQERIEKMKALKQVQQTLITTDDKYQEKLKAVNRELHNLKKANQEAMTSGVNLEKGTSKLAESFVNLTRRVLYYASIEAMKSFIMSVAEVRGEYEMVERSLGAILGDFEKGSKIFREQQKAALKSPFTVIDLANTTKQLAAYNFEASELVDTSRRLADISAALGVPMERLTYNLGQIRAQTVLTARDARDFANAGLPIVPKLAEMYSQLEGRVVSVGEVFDRMSNKMVSFGDVMKVINEYTDEGGMFFDFQAKQAETLKGQLSNLTDAYNNMLNDIGKENQGAMTGLVSGIREALEHWRYFEVILKDVVYAFGAYKAAALLAKFAGDQFNNATVWGSGWLSKYRVTIQGVGDATVVYSAKTKIAIAIQQLLAKGMVFVQKAAYGVVTLFKTMWPMLVIGGIVSLVTHFHAAAAEAAHFREELDKTLSEGVDKAGKLADNFEFLAGRLKQLPVGTREFDEALKQINNTYGEYLPNLLTESNYLVELEKNYNKVTAAIYEKARIQAQESGLQQIFTKYDEDITKYTNKIFGVLTKMNVPEEAAHMIVTKYEEGVKKGLEEGETYISLFQKTYNEILKGSPFLNNKALGTVLNMNMDFTPAINNLAKSYESLDKETESYLKRSDNIFKRYGVESYAEYLKVKEVENLYKELEETVRSSNLQGDALSERLANLQKQQINSLIKLYESFGNSKKVKDLREELARLNEPVVEFKQSVKDLLKDFGTIGNQFMPKQDDSYSKYVDSILKAYKQLKKEQKLFSTGKLVPGTDIETNKTQLKIVKQIGQLLGINFETEKERNKAERKELEYLKDTLSLIEKITSEYARLVKETGNMEYAAEQVKLAYGDSLAEISKGKIDIGQLLTFNRADVIKQMESLTNVLKTEKGKKKLDLAIAEQKVKLAISLNDADVEATKKELDKKFDDYSISLKIKESGDYGDLFATLFDIQPTSLEDLENTVESIIKDMEGKVESTKSAKDGFETIIKSAVASPEDIEAAKAGLHDLQENESKAFKIIEYARKRLAEVSAKYWEDSYKTFESIVSRHGTLSDKLAQIEQKRLTELLSIQEQENKINDRISEVDLELSVATDPNVIQDLQDERDNLENILENQIEPLRVAIDVDANEASASAAFEEWKKTSDSWMKSFEDLSKYGKKTIKSMIDDMEKQLNANKGNMSLKQIKELKEKIEGLKKELDQRSPFKKMVDEFKAIGDAEPADKMQLFSKAMGSLGDRIGEVGDLVSTIGEIGTALGLDPEATEIIGDIAGSLQGLAETSKGISQMAQGDVIGGLVGVIGGVWHTFSGWFDNKNKKINREIEKSERAVKKLQNAYIDLEYAVKSSLGTEETMAKRAAIANKKAQLAELDRQIMLEKSRKKKDQDAEKIAELEGQRAQLANDIKDDTAEIVDNILGQDINSAAEDFASTWLDAFLAGEDAIAALDEKFDDMIKNMIVKTALSQIVKKNLEGVWKTLDEFTQKGSDGDEDLTTDEGHKLGEMLNKAIDTSVQQMQSFVEGWGLDAGDFAKGSKLSGLQKGIQSITEQTAGELQAVTMNMLGQMYEQNNYLLDINNLMNVQVANSSQILLQLRADYQMLQSMRVWMDSVTSPIGNSIQVRLLE